MADKTSSYRMSLSKPVGAPPPERWRAVCGRLWKLDAAQAQRLWTHLPLRLLLMPVASETLEHARQHLERAGLTVELTPYDQRIDPCPRHPQLGLELSCPRCGEPRACVFCLQAEAPPLCPDCRRRAGWRTWFRRIRVGALTAVLLVVLASTFAQDRRIYDWKTPARVGIYPLLAAPSPQAREYVSNLTLKDFAPLATFIDREAEGYGLETTPLLSLTLGRPMAEQPPELSPGETTPIDAIVWSLRLRYWAWRTLADHDQPRADVRLFVVYHPTNSQTRLDHSVGLEKGHIGIVHAFAGPAYQAATQVAIAHELLHTVGATDKYEEGGRPVFPDGYGDPGQTPRYPQRTAEIMAGHVALSPDRFRLARSLDECVIGPQTAREVGWQKEGP